jgi:hypothetical protein
MRRPFYGASSYRDGIKARILLAMAFLCACATAPTPRQGSSAPDVLVEPNATPEVDPGSLQTATRQEIWAYHAYWMGDAWRSYDLREFDAPALHGPAHRQERPRAGDARLAGPVGDAFGRGRARRTSRSIPPSRSSRRMSFPRCSRTPRARRRSFSDIVFLARFSRGVHLDFEVYREVPAAATEGFRDVPEGAAQRLDTKPSKC